MRAFLARRLLVLLLPLVLVTTGLGKARAAEPCATSAPAAPAQPGGSAKCQSSSLAQRDTLTDDWFGFGRTLAEEGVSLSLDLTQIYQQNLHDGTSVHRRQGRYSGRYDLEGSFDLEKLAKIPGGEVFVDVRGGWSEGIDSWSVGSLFGVNGVPIGNEPIDVWQLYYEQSFLDRKVLIRLGKVDLTGGHVCRGCPATFDGSAFANDETTQFLNNCLVNNPTIPFPDPGLGAIVYVEPVEWWYVSAAVADAQADFRETGFKTAFHGRDDAFSIYETGLMPRLPSANGDLQGGYRVGFWYDPQPKDRFDGSGVTRDDVGFYTSCDQVVWKENAPEDDVQGLGVFGRYGVADAAVNEIKSFWSTGAQYTGLIPSRDSDVLSFGVGQGRLGRQAGFTTSNETVLECYYDVAVTPWLHITPDIQYIFHPGGDAMVNDAVVLGIRVHMSF